MATVKLIPIAVIFLATLTTHAAPFRYIHSTSYSCEKGTFSTLSGMRVGPTPGLKLPNLKEKILRPFSTDGCSLSPNGFPGGRRNLWLDCCVKHDMAYWLGGDRGDKARADVQLAQCIGGMTSEKIGKVYEVFVATFGGPFTAFSYRWGYGWNYKRTFAPLSESEKNQVVDIYGVVPEGVEEVISSEPIEIVNLCKRKDIIFRQSVTLDEQLVYHALNSTLKHDTLLQWSKVTTQDSTNKVYSVKIQSCAEPITVTIRRSGGDPAVTGLCRNQL